MGLSQVGSWTHLSPEPEPGGGHCDSDSRDSGLESRTFPRPVVFPAPQLPVNPEIYLSSGSKLV